MERYYEEGIDTLRATVASSNTTDEAVTWTSSNSNVAIVNNGVITAVGVGTAIITATTADGNKSASCSITVNNSTANSIVTFKDKNLEYLVRAEINKPTGDILKSDVEKITELRADYAWIQDISGVDSLTNLQQLDLRVNQISDINVLKGLTNLKFLYLTSNSINDTDKQSLKNALPNCNITY